MTYLELTLQLFADEHHARGVIKLTAVVGCREQGDQLAVPRETDSD